jgi:hypothetical protein
MFNGCLSSPKKGLLDTPVKILFVQTFPSINFEFSSNAAAA